MIGLAIAIGFAAAVVLGAVIALVSAMRALKHPLYDPQRNAPRYVVPATVGVVTTIVGVVGLLVTCVAAIVVAILG